MQRFQHKRVALSALVLLFLGGFVCTQAIHSLGQSQAEMNDAAGRDYKKTDNEMNVSYKKLMGVLDADSEHLNHFDSIDQQYLEKIVALLQIR